MKKFMGFVIKEFRHILRDIRTMLILFGMPVIQLILFGYAIRNEITDVKIAVLDRADDYMSRELADKLLSSDYFILIDRLNDESEIERAFRSGRIKEAIVIEPQFTSRILREGKGNVQIIADASDPNMAQMMIAYTSSIIQDYQLSISQARSVPKLVVPEIKMLYNPEMKSVFFFVPGIIVILLTLICALMTSITITREKELGTMEVLLVSPLKPIQIITGKVIPYVFLSLINTTTILVIARYVFGVPFAGSYVLFYTEALLFIVTALSLGILISTISNSQQVAMMASLAGLMLPVIMLSGFVFPVTSMPWPLQWLSDIVPAKWFLTIVKGIMLKGVGFEYLWKETLILIGMTLFLLALSAKKFKIRLQ